jgi:hypothetical protein
MVVAMRDLSLHLMDIIQNSLKADADAVKILIEADSANDSLSITIEDNGNGMSPEILSGVSDPFVTTRSTRKIGLGIPLFKEHCELTGGDLSIVSELGKGTRVYARLGLGSIDRMPLGSISETMAMLVLSDPKIDYYVGFKADGNVFELAWPDIRAQLGDVPLNEPAVVEWIRENLTEQQQYIFGGVLHEITH